jgi:hypothetical protein
VEEYVSTYWMAFRKQEYIANRNLKKEAIYRTLWRIRFGRDNGHVARQTK